MLEYGSGLASKAFLLADHGAASVAGIDISPVAVDAGNERVRYLYRRRIPELRTPDEHRLLMGDLDLLSEFVRVVRGRFVHLTSLAAVPFRGRASFSSVVRLLDRADRALFRAVPPLRRYAWQVVLELSEPRTQLLGPTHPR